MLMKYILCVIDFRIYLEFLCDLKNFIHMKQSDLGLSIKSESHRVTL